MQNIHYLLHILVCTSQCLFINTKMIVTESYDNDIISIENGNRNEIKKEI